ncbi:stress protein DDR48-like [Daphnia pulex]|jgi:hypothetical protein|uniref:stress protein DDR48-like n=1 Tax=Daphnia pulex TaxID=6669 RepID=UPI001EDD5536|nr:stress protein DDR48-like [Daphnia pulex]
MQIELHLTGFAIVLNIATSVPNGLVRRLGAGFESIVVYAVPTSHGVSDQSYSSTNIGQNYYFASNNPSYSPSSGDSSHSSPSSVPSYSSPSSIGQNYYSPSDSPSYSSPSSDGTNYSSPSSDQGYSSSSSDPIDSPYSTATFCRHTSHSTEQRNYRHREQTYQPVVRETFRSRNNYYSSHGNEKTAQRTPNYSVRDSFESSHRQNIYARDHFRVGQACTPIIQFRQSA